VFDYDLESDTFKPDATGSWDNLSKRRNRVPVSKDIKPMFWEVDIDHMKVHGVHLDDYQYMSDATKNYANAEAVGAILAGSNHASWRPILDRTAA